MWCKQCKTDKPSDKFYKPRERGLRVVICDDCARENMRRYWQYVEKDPDKVRRKATKD